MKTQFRLLVSAACILGLLVYSGCGPDNGPEPSVEEAQFDKLKTTWTVSNVTLDNVNKTTDYTGFKLTLGGSLPSSLTYTTTGRPALSPWPGDGDWEFSKTPDDPASSVVRDPGTTDELKVGYTVTDTQLQLTFTFARDGYTRTSNVKGQWVFTFTK